MTNPQPFLLLPGLLCDARLWRDQCDALPDVAAPLVANLSRDATVEAMAERALAEADAAWGAGASFALAGLSMGGYVAMEIMRRAPGRVRRLALFDTSARADTEEQARRRRGLMALTRSGQFRGVTPRLLPQLLHRSNLDGPLSEEVSAMAERVGREAFLSQQEAILARPDSQRDLAHVAVPTLVAAGAEDLLTPPELAVEIAEAIPGSVVVTLPGCGHLPTMERPRAVNLLLRGWLGW